jgi:uncharacterized membrane protein
MKIYDLPRSPERSILFASIAMSFLLLGVVGYYLISNPMMSRTLVLVFIAHAFGGRAAGVGLCLMDELNPFFTIFYNLFLEVLIVCWTYSLFVLSINNYLKFRVVKFYSIRLERKARKYKQKIANYGWLGIFLFVMLPLPATGPVIGSIVGYLLRLKVWYNLLAAFLGTFVAIVVWFVFFDILEQNLHIIRYVFYAIIAVAALSYLFTIKEWFSKHN